MKKSLSVWQLFGFVITGVMGVLLHFLFDWTRNNAMVGAFSAINESIWEHMKILFFPMFVFALIERRYVGKDCKNIWCVKLIGILSGVVLIPVLYYTINGIFGRTPDWVNITIFFVTAAISYIVETYLFKHKFASCKSPRIALFVLWMIALAFVIFTFNPPHIPLFCDPVTGSFGY